MKTYRSSFPLFFGAIAAAFHVEQISEEELQWAEVIASGYSGSQIQGFMTENQYLKSLHHQDPPVPML